MSLVDIGGAPIVPIGMPIRLSTGGLPSLSNVTMDATNEACIMYGQIVTDDGASHTLDTSGSSAILWKAGTATFANAGTTVKVGLAAVDLASGPPARASNVSDVITFSVSKSLTGGGGGIPTGAWQSHAPDTGSLAVANGDFLALAIQMTARGGSDSVQASMAGISTIMERPGVTAWASGYSAQNVVPNAIIVFSDGHLGWFFGGHVFEIPNVAQTWNSGSGQKEYGNFFQFPFPMKIHGITADLNVSGNLDVILYSDPLGTPVAEKTVSVDANAISIAAARYGDYLFSSPYQAAANQPLAAIIKPTSATNVSAQYKQYNSSAHQVTEMGGVNGYGVSRNTGAFAATNTSRDRFGIGLLVGAFDAGGGGGGGLSAPLFGGGVL